MSPPATFVSGLRCVLCDRSYAYGEQETTCPSCGVDGILDVEYDEEAIRRAGFLRAYPSSDAARSIWRYRALLPIESGWSLPRLQVGWTPVYEAPSLARELGIEKLLIKDEGREPTGSFKDRSSAVGATRALGLGRKQVACASTGNAATSLAGFCADLGIEAFIFVPAFAPEAKLAQLLVYGATVLQVEGDYAAAFELCQQAIEAFGWYNRNCAINPYLVEGKKTCGLEIGEQLAARPPDVVAVSVGDGCTIAGIWKGLTELHRFGLIPRLPRLLGVQAEGAQPIARAFAAGEPTVTPSQADTLADSINVGAPRNGVKALRAVRASGGQFVTVSDQAILEAIPRLARGSGVFAEPTAAASLAGIQAARERGLIGAGESVLQVVTGNGLKDVRGALRSVSGPHRIPPTLEAVRQALQP
ncbi:MAG TPA: threonine synthase [Acidobacteriota bacterium]